MFTLVVDEVAGTWTFTLLDHLDHPTVSTEDNLTLSFNVTGTDGDGDAVVQALSVNVDDDMPVLTAATETKTVYEDLLSGGNPDTPPNPVGASTIATGTLAGLVSVGADQPGFFSFITMNGLPSQNTSNGAPVLGTTSASLAGGPLDTLTTFVESNGTPGFQSGAGGDRQVYTFVITDPATGAYTFTLLDQLDHGLGADNFDDATLAIELGVLLNYTDADGDSILLTGRVPIVVENDVPTAVSPADATLVNALGRSFTGTLDLVNGDVDNNVGADEPGTIGFRSALQGANSGLTSSGQPIIYYIVGNVLFGATVALPTLELCSVSVLINKTDLTTIRSRC